MEEGNKKARYLRCMFREIIDNRLTGRHFPEQLRGARDVTNKGIEMTLPFRDLKTKSGNDKAANKDITNYSCYSCIESDQLQHLLLVRA